MRRWYRHQRFWRQLPLPSFLLFLGAVGVTFASMGFLGDIVSLDRQTFSKALYGAALSGIVSMAYAAAFTRSFVWFVAVFVIQSAGWWFMTGPAERGPWLRFVDLDTARRLRYDQLGATAAVFLGYLGFLTFIGRQGRRWFAMRAEMDLAHDIHQTLVPPINTRIAGVEFHGISQPSGEVGGDLVDVVDMGKASWLAYVADVSGHGVSSGLIMGMVKSAMRMGAANDRSLEQIVGDLNRLLCTQLAPNMFVTLAAIRGDGPGPVETLTAGHPPVIRMLGSSRRIEEGVMGEHVPVGVTPDWVFQPATIMLQPGDTLVVLTDGLFEVFDKADQQLGLEGIKKVLSDAAGLPLADIADRVVQRARAFGPQLDDQTILLVRR
jgi:hypothetical protein